MSKKSEKVFLKGLMIAAVFCLLPLGVYLYHGFGASVSVGHFEFQRRGDAKWDFQKTKISELSWAGATLRTGLAYSVGPFRVADWKEPAGGPARLTETQALAVATSAIEKAGNHLDDFKTPRIMFHTKGRQWTIFWERKAPISPNGHLMVVVDDTIGEARLTPSEL